MWQDEILDEIHKIREEHAESFNYDLDAMFADWQKKQAESGREGCQLVAKTWFNKALESAAQDRSVKARGDW